MALLKPAVAGGTPMPTRDGSVTAVPVHLCKVVGEVTPMPARGKRAAPIPMFGPSLEEREMTPISTRGEGAAATSIHCDEESFLCKDDAFFFTYETQDRRGHPR